MISMKCCVGNRRRESGFTLIEMVVALGVLLLGMISVLSLFTAAISLHKEAIDQTDCALLAEEVVGRVRSQLDAGREAKAVEQAFADWQDPTRPHYRVTVDLTEVSNDAQVPEWRASVAVRFRKGAKDRRETFETVIVRDAFAAGVRKARSS